MPKLHIPSAGGITLTGNYIPFGDGSGSYTEDSLFNYDSSTKTLSVQNIDIGLTAQLSGGDTSGDTDILVNPLVKTSGNLIDLQINGASKFSVDRNGTILAVSIDVSGKIEGTYIRTNGGIQPGQIALFENSFGGTDASGVAWELSHSINRSGATGLVFTDLKINRTETSLGTTPGEQLFVDFQVGGSSKFKIKTTGEIVNSPYWTDPYPFSDESTDIADSATAVYTFYLAEDRDLLDFIPQCAVTAPVGQDVILDIHKNGTTIYTIRPQIAAGNNTGTSGAFDGTSNEMSSGDKIEVFIDQVGTTTAGVGLKGAFQWKVTS